MRPTFPLVLALAWTACAGPADHGAVQETALRPGSRVWLDAHNAYPDGGAWQDRIDRALSTGLPLAIEQDLCLYTSPDGRSWSIVSHGEPFSGQEPTLERHFFEKIRPLVEKELREGDPAGWPVLVLNLDFKKEWDVAAHHREIWELLGRYEDWLCTAEKSSDPAEATPIRPGPLLVLTGSSAEQARTFYEEVPLGGRLRLFGAVVPEGNNDLAPARQLVPRPAGNYRRWWNNPWKVVEGVSPRDSGDWTETENRRLAELVEHAHNSGLWIRFYTLNGHAPAGGQGWTESYNFGSLSQAEQRWMAAVQAGVDFVATDQYEDFSALLTRAP